MTHPRDDAHRPPLAAASPWPLEASAWIFHSGAALGDFILCFPLVRALIAQGHRVAVVAAASKASLAREFFNREFTTSPGPAHVLAVPDHLHHLASLWREDEHPNPIAGAIPPSPPPSPPVTPAARVVHAFTPAHPAWLARARRVFPHAEINIIDRPLDRVLTTQLAPHHIHPATSPDTIASSPVFLHVGAGSRTKRWPLQRWLELRDRLAASTAIELIAGEVEREQFSQAHAHAFQHAGGRWITDLPDLFKTLSTARAFIGADTGPTHLAAQLGLPTLALFGPTDPARWSPLGPRVRVVAPSFTPPPPDMQWLTVEDAHIAARALLQSPLQNPAQTVTR